MTVYAADGTTKLSKTSLTAKLTTVPSTTFTANEDIYETYNYDPYKDNFKTFEKERRVKFKAGQVVNQADVDLLFTPATIASISPATGVAAGGIAVTIRGSRFAGATGGTLGGVALTSFVTVNDSTITAVTGAHATGVVDLIVTDDSGPVTSVGAFTYV